MGIAHSVLKGEIAAAGEGRASCNIAKAAQKADQAAAGAARAANTANFEVWVAAEAAAGPYRSADDGGLRPSFPSTLEVARVVDPPSK